MIQTILSITTDGARLYEITEEISAWLDAQTAHKSHEGPGLLTIFIQHTSASLLIQENADPDVQADLQAFYERLVPAATAPEMAYLRHRSEGPDDMPAHIKSALTQTSLSIPTSSGRMLLGRWQGIFVFEHRTRPHNRSIVLHLAP